jgi:hypothetical protein
MLRPVLLGVSTKLLPLRAGLEIIGFVAVRQKRSPVQLKYIAQF